MTNELFNSNNFKELTSEEYYLYKKKLNSSVFNRVFFKGTSKKLINSLENQPKNLHKIESEKEIFYNYDFSIQQKERLLNYFGKELTEEILTFKNEYFQSVLNQIEMINSLISPVFKELDIDYELHLTGGALRDHILNKTTQVKDLDILIEFSDKLYIEYMKGKNSVEKKENQKIKIERFFIEKETIIKKYNLIIHKEQSREKILHEIVYQIVNKIKDSEVKNFLLWDENKSKFDNSIKEAPLIDSTKINEITPDDSIIYDGLFSVIKVKVKNFKYPMDLLLNSCRYSYLNNFDFNICKCLYTVKRLEINKKVDRLYLYDGFIKDVVDETLSLNSSIFNDEKQIDRCLKDHYIRLKNKYAEYKINILESAISEDLMNYIKKAHMYYLMESQLTPKGISNTIKKYKI